MYKIYEVRDRLTHRIEYLNLFKFDETPQEKFRQNPDSQLFAGRYNLYFNTREEEFLTEEEAWAFVTEKHLEYKIKLNRHSVYPPEIHDGPKEYAKIIKPGDPEYKEGNPLPKKRKPKSNPDK